MHMRNPFPLCHPFAGHRNPRIPSMIGQLHKYTYSTVLFSRLRLTVCKVEAVLNSALSPAGAYGRLRVHHLRFNLAPRARGDYPGSVIGLVDSEENRSAAVTLQMYDCRIWVCYRGETKIIRADIFDYRVPW